MKSIIYKYIIVVLALSVFGCGNDKNKAADSEQKAIDQRLRITKEQFHKNNMSLGNITEEVFPITIKANGVIDVPPENKAIVNSITGGYIKTVPFLVGDIVRKGQVLVTLENPEFVGMQQEYMEVKEQLNYLKSEYERQKTMYNENVISEKKYLMAESQYKSANAKYNGLRKQLSMLNINPLSVEKGDITSIVNIYAPISGSITRVNVSRGAYVSPTTSILEIIDNDHVHIELSVFEKHIMKVKKDQDIHFSIPEVSDEIFEAKVHLVGAAIEENRIIKVHGHPLDESKTFFTGMFVNAEIIIDQNTVKVLPETAIVEDEGSHYILILNEENDTDYYFDQVKVKVGHTVNGFTEIMSTPVSVETSKVLINGVFGLIVSN